MAHIGNIILEYCRQNQIPAARAAANIGMSRPGFYKLLNKNDMSLSRLRQISQALNHNFFTDYYNAPGQPSKSQSAIAIENKKLKEKLKQLETEVTYLKEINQLQRSTRDINK